MSISELQHQVACPTDRRWEEKTQGYDLVAGFPDICAKFDADGWKPKAGEPEDDTRQLSPEQELWLAVLQQAIDDSRHGIKAVADDARKWLASNRSNEGSFLWICQIFDMSPSAIRRAMGVK